MMPATSGLAVLPDDRAGGGAVIRLTGPLVVRTAAFARHALAELLEQRRSDVVIDLRSITELDAAGLAAVTSGALAARRRGIDVTVLPPAQAEPRRFAERVGVLALIGGR